MRGARALESLKQGRGAVPEIPAPQSDVCPFWSRRADFQAGLLPAPSRLPAVRGDFSWQGGCPARALPSRGPPPPVSGWCRGTELCSAARARRAVKGVEPGSGDFSQDASPRRSSFQNDRGWLAPAGGAGFLDFKPACLPAEFFSETQDLRHGSGTEVPTVCVGAHLMSVPPERGSLMSTLNFNPFPAQTSTVIFFFSSVPKISVGRAESSLSF